MKDKIIETIRQILIHTVLPIRRKKEEVLSKFRFSIAFRIAWNYFKLSVVYGAIFIGLVTVTNLYYHDHNRVSELEQHLSDISKTDTTSRWLQDLSDYTVSERINYRLKEVSTGEVLYNDLDVKIDHDKRWFDGIYTNLKDEQNYLVSKHKFHMDIQGKEYQIKIQVNLSNECQQFGWLLIWMIIFLFVIFAVMFKHGQKGTIQLLEPLKTMSDTANRLTVNNLHSERLNVEGTKNELKDLATTMNGMLDRIETSYESQKQFVSDASHELRTPIAVIQGYANMLDRWGKRDEAILEESIEAIRNEAKSMQDLVEKLLFLSRHDKKTLKLKKAKFDICDVVEEMVKETKLITKDRIVTSDRLESVIVYGDKQALKQAVRVFIDNAVKYTRDGDIIRINCENRDGDCVITVSDTGIGMTRKDVNNIFERFYRSDEVRNGKIAGHGLGLSIAKLIVLKHAGSIKVRSQYTKGTEFTITLPKRQLY